MFCKNCGKEIEDGTKFCPHCGTSIAADTPSTEQAPPKRSPVAKTASNRNGLKTAKLIIGIISIVLFIIIAFQSCAAGLSNALLENGESSGSAGIIVAFFMLISGIVGISTRNSKGGGITAGVFYALAGIIGLGNYGSYGDLQIWSILCLIFAAIFIIGSARMKKPQ